MPETDIALPPEPAQPLGVGASSATAGLPTQNSAGQSEIRRFLRSRGNSAAADAVFRWLIVLSAISLFVIVALIAFELVARSRETLARFGWHFFVGTAWDPVQNHYGALPFLYGTVVSSLIGLVLSVPLAIGVSVFLTEMCPKFLRAPLSFLTELLAAIPSVVYGLWAIFVLAPILRDYVNPVLIAGLGWTGFFAKPNFGVGMLAAGVVLAIMILPIIASLTREVMTAVPNSQREAVLALGATRWEMIRMGVLRNARIGIVGAMMLGLGRALGETMAVTMVIGNRPDILRNLLAPAYSMASVIANEFTEASSPMYLSALVEIGLVLFVVTILVNALARLLVWAVTRDAPPRSA